MKNEFRKIGIPLKEVGQRLQELNDAIKEHDMAISANAMYQIESMERSVDMAKCVTMTVYFFEHVQEENKQCKNQEN